MSEQKLALIDGSYPSLMSGGVQAELLANNSSLNSCIPDKIGMWKMWYVSTDGNAQTITDKPTEVTTAFKVEAIKIYEVTGGARVIQRLNDMRSNEFARYGTENGSGGTNFHAWEEIVTSTGTYPNLTVGKAQGAEYLSKRHRLQTDSVQQGWLKIGTALMSTVATYQCYNCIMIISGVYRGTGAATTAPKTAIVEIEARKYAATLGDTRIGILAGDIPADSLCFAVEDNLDISLYIYNNYTENIDIQFEILSEELSNKTHANIFEFSSDDTTLASAPSGAVYAVVRNIASYAESIPAASQTVLGGVKVYTDSEGYLNIDTQ